MSPTATVFLRARREFLALRGGEYLGRVGKGLRNASGRLLGELQMLGAQLDSDPQLRSVFTSLASLFGRVSGTLDVTSHGLAMWSTMEMK